MAKITLTASDQDQPVVVDFQQVGDAAQPTYDVLVGTSRIEARLLELRDGSGLLYIQGKVTPFHCTQNGQQVTIWLGGKLYTMEALEPTRRRSGDHAVATTGTNELTAPMPGTILKINVSAGDAYRAGEPLIIMESMKMELTLSSPAAGRVREILCKVGELVDLGRVLARLEATGDNGQPA